MSSESATVRALREEFAKTHATNIDGMAWEAGRQNGQTLWLAHFPSFGTGAWAWFIAETKIVETSPNVLHGQYVGASDAHIAVAWPVEEIRARLAQYKTPMSSKILQSDCRWPNKMRYGSIAEATPALQVMKASASEKNRFTLQVYPCGDHYHIGKKPSVIAIALGRGRQAEKGKKC